MEKVSMSAALKAAQLRYKLKYPDRVKQSKQKWRENNPEKDKACKLEWARANPEKNSAWHNSNTPEVMEYRRRQSKLWATNHPEYVRAKTMIRHKRCRQAMPKWVEWKDIIAVYYNVPIDYHVDHIVPIVGITPEGYRVSGLNVPWNLQHAPALDNRRKGSRMTDRCYEIACSLTK